VPMDQVGAATQAGGKLIPYGSQSSEQVVQDQTGIHPDPNPVTSGIEGLGRAIAGPITGLYGMAKSAFAPPTNDEENAAQGAGGPVGLAADRMIVQPARTALNTAKGLYNSGHPFAAAGATLGALPVIGAMGQASGQRAAAGDITGAVTEGLGNALMPSALKEAAPLVKSLPGIKQVVQNNQTVPGENYTPVQHKAFSGVLARGTGMGKDFIAPDVASDIASPVRQAAADNPSLAQVVQNGKPKDALGASQAILQKAKDAIDRQHQMALQPVASTPVDMQPVLDAIPADQPFHSTAEKSQVQALRDQAWNVQTLGDLNNFRQYLGNENSPSFRQSAVAAGRSSVADKALQATDSAARNHYYDQLEQATGLDFQGLKRTESGIIKAQEALQNTSPSLVNKDVLSHEDTGVLGTAANMIDTGTRAAHGLPFVGYLAEKLRGTPLEQVQSGMQRFLSDLPQPSTYRGPLTSQWSPAPRSLPANVPANVPFTPGGGGQTVNTMFSGQGQVGPSQVTPAPPTPLQLPRRTGPEFYTPAGVRGGYAGGMDVPPATTRTYPALNQATAQTSVNAGRPRPAQESIPQRTINVSPEGGAMLRRPQLLAPKPPVLKVKPKKRNEIDTFPQADTALPAPIQRVLRATGATIKPATGPGDGYHEAVASVSPDAPNTIQVEDPKRFEQNKAQTVAHEAFHVWRNNLPPHVRAMAPQDDTDQYNYADPNTMVRLRQQGKRLWDLPEESGATALQYYTSQGAENAPKKIVDAYKPWAEDMDVPMSTIMPTAANAQELNTAPRPPGTMYETKTFAKGVKPVLKPAANSSKLDLRRGAPVQLPDGTKGKIAHVIENMQTVRVRTNDGRNLTVRQTALKPVDSVFVKEHFRSAPS
jgi:hypothetical protein